MADNATPNEESGLGTPSPPSNLELKKVILEGSKAITEKIDVVAITVALLHQDMGKMSRVEDLGTITDDMNEVLGTHTMELADQERQLQAHEAKLADLEDRSRRNNVRILGLPEGTEATLVEQFLESCLVEILPRLGNDGKLPVDRAHRTLGGRLKPGSPPRLLIMWMLWYKDKMNIQKEARKTRTVEYNGNRISFYPDYGVATQRRRRSIMAVKHKLRDKGLDYALLPPARLRIDVQGTRRFLKTMDNWC
ncbi:hypothetical protein NDU88_004517 [Pleurodeles waltl]|uniref:Uncharacterized protein n=1 Tax=Pleurodeles waltl TaxID=8319 RepID=A0AAV7WS70_PLEWA|nr:hypothetical protein NDU88_004517 [Pleurodeles waltl]